MNIIDYTINRDQLGIILNQLNYTSCGAEIGVHFGGHSEEILKIWNGKLLYSIDIWEQQPREIYDDLVNVDNVIQSDHYNRTVDLLKKFGDRSKIIKSESTIAAKQFSDESLDFVYIDANHSYEGLTKDLESWYPKVKTGGLICGDDYVSSWAGVIQATNEFFGKLKKSIIEGGRTSTWQWFVLK